MKKTKVFSILMFVLTFVLGSCSEESVTGDDSVGEGSSSSVSSSQSISSSLLASSSSLRTFSSSAMSSSSFVSLSTDLNADSSHSGMVLDTVIFAKEVWGVIGVDTSRINSSVHWIGLWDSLMAQNSDTLVSAGIDSAWIPDDEELGLHWCTFPEDSLGVQKTAQYVSVGDAYVDSSFHTVVLNGADTLYQRIHRFYWQQPTKHYRVLRESCMVGDVKMMKQSYCGSDDQSASGFIFSFPSGVDLYTRPKMGAPFLGFYFLSNSGEDVGFCGP